MSDDLHFIFLEVTKCRLSKDASLVEKLGYALNKLQYMDKKPDFLDGELFDLLFTSADLTNFAPEDKIKYLNDMTTERDIRNQITFAHDKGLEEGMEKGVRQEKTGIARKMLGMGLDVGIISQATNLSAEEIDALKRA